jgi:DNA modification methylase
MKKLNLLVNPNDVFKLGDQILACGNCLDAQLVDKAIGESKIKLVISDSPYGVSYVESKESLGQKVTVNKMIQNDCITNPEEYKEFTSGWLTPTIKHLERKNSFYMFNGDKMLLPVLQAIENSKFTFSQLLIWVKSQPIMGRKDFAPQHELILFGWHGVHEFMKSKDRSVLFHPKPQNNKLHPTMKPISLLRRLILNSTRVGDIVYDPFLGSGSTLVACEHTKRKCIGIEIDPDYCQIIIQRWEKLTGGKAVRQ